IAELRTDQARAPKTRSRRRMRLERGRHTAAPPAAECEGRQRLAIGAQNRDLTPPPASTAPADSVVMGVVTPLRGVIELGGRKPGIVRDEPVAPGGPQCFDDGVEY